MRIALAVGGTGGHILPALEIAKRLQSEGAEIHLIGVYLDKNPHLDRTFLHKSVDGSNRCVMRISKGIWQSICYLRKNKIDKIIGFGSYHSFPVLAAALLLKKPYVLFEANLYPGKVNRIFAKWAKWVAVQFSEALHHFPSNGKKINFLSQRFAFVSPSLQEAANYYDFDPLCKTILVMGGSLGAKSINEKMLEMAQKLSSPIQVIHILGKQGDIEEVKKRYDALNIKSVVKRFEDNMQHAYAISSFSLARAGAATIAELIHFEVPAILIPYPFAKDQHQLKNALYFEDQVKGGVCIEEKDFSELFTMLNTFLDAKFLEDKKSDISSYKSSLSDFSIAEIFS